MTSKALTAWTELNDRQQGTLAAIFGIEQAIEKARGRGAARGDWDATPAALWRRIDFSLDPTDHRYSAGRTELQYQLELAGWHNQGNGATMAALAERELITQDEYAHSTGWMRTVTLTRAGRAAARAGTTLRTGTVPRAALKARAWEVLALLWAADQRGDRLRWRSSTTIDNTLIGKHVPPLAAQLPGWDGGYEITDRGRDFYREHYKAHIAAHPDIRAMHPDGDDADPWPRADEILAAHHLFTDALADAWRQALADHAAAEAEAEAGPTPTAANAVLPGDVAELAAARRRLWQETAAQRAALAAAHVDQMATRTQQAARTYAVAALTAYKAAVAGTDPLPDLDQLKDPATPADDWDEIRLAPPPETGIHVLDNEANKLHKKAVGARVRRRGPAPKQRRHSRAAAPGGDLTALADYLRTQTTGGALSRRLHPQT